MALKVSSVLAAWKQFDLNNFQQSVDETASEVALKQDESDVSRKKLVEQFKSFKNDVPEDIRKQAAPLIKSFQAEVDNLTKRSKFAESAFLHIYKSILEINDPVPSLDYCLSLEKKIGKFTDLEIENKNLRETLQEYNEEFKDIRNQDVTIKNLKEQLKAYEETLSNNVSSKIKSVEKDLQQVYFEKERLLEESQNSVLRRLEEAETKAQTLQQTLVETQSELFEYKSKKEESVNAQLEETNMLINDLERANGRAALAEKEIVRLQELMSKAEVNDDKTSALQSDVTAAIHARSSLEVELSVKDKEIVQLVDDIKSLQTTLQQYREESATRLTASEARLDEKSKEVEKLQAELHNKKDYQEIKRELSIIKSVEFGAPQEISDDEIGNQNKPLEALLMEKNKSLQNENTVVKQANLDLTKHVSESNVEVSNLRSLCNEQKGLISQLESDLASMQSFSSIYRGEGEGCPSMPEMVAEAVKTSTLNAEGALHEIIISDRKEATGQESQSATISDSASLSGSIGEPASISAAESLLPIVSAQRERFKLRNEELEAELTAKSQQNLMLQNEVDTLRSDNVKLYEKIRFLQSYRNDHSSDSSVTESRYSGQYEESLDPFASFSRKEKMRKYSALSPFEKITLSFGQFILSSKTARTFAFIYTALLQIMVFLVLYKLVHTESCKRDFASDCANKFAEHMHTFHGEG